MNKQLYYCGIGSRKSDENILILMTKLSSRLEELSWILRSGGAIGADLAFEKGVANPQNKQIFLARDAKPWAFDLVKSFLPNDRSGFDYWKPYIKSLLARNMMQVFGENNDSPVKFILCWTKSLKYETSEVGGTGYAIRAALKHNIPVYNILEIGNDFDKIIGLINDSFSNISKNKK